MTDFTEPNSIAHLDFWEDDDDFVDDLYDAYDVLVSKTKKYIIKYYTNKTIPAHIFNSLFNVVNNFEERYNNFEVFEMFNKFKYDVIVLIEHIVGSLWVERMNRINALLKTAEIKYNKNPKKYNK